jgi:RNA-directed DNA polymerase
MNQPPQDTQLFQQEVQLVQGLLFGCDGLHGAEGSVQSAVLRIERVVDQPLGQSKAVRLREVSRTVQRPGEKLLDQRENRRAGGSRHESVRGGYFTLADIASVDNLMAAAKCARRHKSRKPDVEDFFHKLESNVMALHESLMNGTWQPGEYHHFWITDPKRRYISAAPFADRVVHHALCLWLEPLLSKRFIAHSFSCQSGKGTGAARECVRKLTNQYRYVLKCDVRKFFESIDHEILCERLFKVVHCPGLREVMRRIVKSHATTGREFSCGLPLGNLTSQLWANFFLDPLDHWITETMRFGAYARYTDDFLIFGDDKTALHELRVGIESQLTALRLVLAEDKTRLMTTSEGVPFCGFVFRPGLRPRVLGATKRRFEQRRTHLARARDIFTLSRTIVSWYSFSREGNAAGLHRAYARWSLRQRHRQKRQRGRTTRVLRGGSWNNNDRGNLLSSNRNHNTPGNRNNNNGFRVVVVPGSAPKPAATLGVAPGGASSPVRAKKQTNPRSRALDKMPLPEEHARSDQGKDAAATVVTGRMETCAYGMKSPWLAC